MSKIKVKLRSAGVRALLKSPEMQAACQAEADRIAQTAGEGYTTSAKRGKTRATVSVTPETFQAKRREAKTHALIKAVKGG